MSIRSPVIYPNDPEKFSFKNTTRQFRLQRAVRTHRHIRVRVPLIILIQFPRDDINHSTHGIRSVKHRSRSSQHLHPFRQHGLAGICDGMSQQSRVLRNAIHQHQHARVRMTSTDSPHREHAGSPPGDPVSQHAPAGREQTGNPIVQQGQQGESMTSPQLLVRNRCNRHGQMTRIRLVARSSNHHFFQLLLFQCICLCRQRPRSQQQTTNNHDSPHIPKIYLSIFTNSYFLEPSPIFSA